jgi:choloylglycine hydrolase
MEFPVDLNSKAVVVPRGRSFTSVNDEGVEVISWENKYGFLGIDAFNVKNVYLEGINEKGLAYDALMFTGAVYQPAVPGKFVTISDLGAWVLGISPLWMR